jgi:hypothetical protein
LILDENPHFAKGSPEIFFEGYASLKHLPDMSDRVN